MEFRRLFAASLMLLPSFTFAGLLQIDVPSATRGGDAEQVALKQGLADAVTRLTGQSKPEWVSGLGNPMDYVSSFYDEVAPGEAGGWVYHIEYERDAIVRKLPAEAVVGDSAAEAVKDSPAPLIEPELVDGLSAEIVPRAASAEADRMIASLIGPQLWVLVEPLEAEPHIVNKDDNGVPWVSEIRSAVRGRFSLPEPHATGASVVTPSMMSDRRDVELQALVPPPVEAQTWMAILTEAGPKSWLGRVHKLGQPDNELFGDAETPAEALTLALSGASLDPVIPDVQSVPAHTTVTADDAGSLVIRVDNIVDYADYRRAARLLDSLQSVESWSPRGSEGEVAVFELKLSSDSAALVAELDSLPEQPLVSDTDTGASFMPVDLSFRLN